MTENEKLDPGTFDLGQWIQGKNTYPSYTVTVHVDREAGKQLADIDKQISDKNKQYDELVKASEKDAGTGSLTESPATAKAKDADALAKELKKLRGERKSVLEQYQGSALKITFRIEKRNVGDELFKSLRQTHPELSEHTDAQIQEEVSGNEAYAQTQLAFQFIATVAEMVDASGQKADLNRLTAETAASFLQSLSADQQRTVMTNMNLAMMGGREVETQVDAGFPG